MASNQLQHPANNPPPKKSLKVHFACDCIVHELSHLPYVSGFYFIKWRVISGSSSMSSAADSSGSVAAPGVLRDWRSTHRAPVRNHVVVWNTPLATSADSESLELVIQTDRDGTLMPCELALVVKQEANGGRSAETVGSALVNLSEMANEKYVVRRFLLQESKVNASIKISISMTLTKGSISDYKTPKPSSKAFNMLDMITEDMFTMGSLDSSPRSSPLFSAISPGNTSSPNATTIVANSNSWPSHLAGTKLASSEDGVFSSSPTSDDKILDLSFYDESEDIRIVEDTFARIAAQT